MREVEIKPINGNVFVKIKRQREVGGLVLVHKEYEDKEKTLLAEVIIADNHNKDGLLKPGDTVIIKGYAGIYAGETEDGHTRRAVQESEIIARVDKRKIALEVI